jgi:hypothetical protein
VVDTIATVALWRIGVMAEFAQPAVIERIAQALCSARTVELKRLN